jgi:TRAP-type C4-dicarboxylate transport system permease small subunit
MLARVLLAAALATSAVAVAALALMGGVTVVDVTGRYFFNKPFFGTVEICEFLMALLSFGALALAELRNGHITVDFFITALPERVQAWLEAGGTLLGIVFWWLVAWRAGVHAGRIWEAGEVSANWAVPTWPFYLGVTVGCGLLTLALIPRLLRALRVGTGSWTTPPSA